MSPLVSVPQHIPAWKRLGLKLKYAKDEPVTKTNLQVVSKADEPKKRKSTDEEAIETNTTSPPPKKAKKPKKIHNVSNETSLSGNIHSDGKSIAVRETQLETVTSDPPSDTKFRQPQPTKRKSVSFAPEAKTQDGDSAKDLYDQWLFTQKSDDATFDPTTAAAALKVVAPTSKVVSTDTTESTSEAPDDQRTKKKKSKKKSKSTTIKPGQNLISSKSPQQSSAKDSEPRPHAALSYLTAFQDSPKTWKFCKNHQTYLLKNLFSLQKIPCSYNPALKAYLTGLKGLSARQSIRNQALEIREKDEMFLSDILAKGRREGWEAERRREQYEAAWKQEKDRLEEIEDLREWEEGKEEFEWRLKKRRRAEDVLWAVGEVESKQPDTPKTTESKSIAPAASTVNAALSKINGRGNSNSQKKQPEPKKKRKRKRRTTGVPDDDMFNSSSSSSDSDSDAELQKKKPTEDENVPKRTEEAGKKLNDSSPSSGLGGSSTDSEKGGTSSSGSEESESDSDDEDDGSSSDADGSGEESDNSDD